MKLPGRGLLFIFLLVTAVLAILGWWNWPEVRFRLALHRLSVSAEAVPAYHGALEGFSVNSFSDEVSSATIGRLYDAACCRLESLRGSYPRRTYLWEDLMSYPRVTSVIQFPGAYLSVTAANNNDNDSVWVHAGPGVFPPADHSPNQFLNLQELPDERLPKGMLHATQFRDRWP